MLIQLIDEILLLIASNLSFTDIVNLMRTNSKLHCTLNDNSLWQKLFALYFPNLHSKMQTENIESWYHEFRKVHRIQYKHLSLDKIKLFTYVIENNLENLLLTKVTIENLDCKNADSQSLLYRAQLTQNPKILDFFIKVS